jgi:hypothetical protein
MQLDEGMRDTNQVQKDDWKSTRSLDLRCRRDSPSPLFDSTNTPDEGNNEATR